MKVVLVVSSVHFFSCSISWTVLFLYRDAIVPFWVGTFCQVCNNVLLFRCV